MLRWVAHAALSTIACISAGAHSEEVSVTIERLNPDRLHPPVGQSLIVVSSANRVAYYTANALDAEGNLVGGDDFEKQNEQVAKNIAIALEELGADHTNIIKMTGYIVNYDAAFHGPLIAKALAANPPDYEYPATMLVSVNGLARPDLLLEIEIVVGLDHSAARLSPE